MPNLSIRLLGPFTAELDGKQLSAFRSNKVRALLVYLAVEQHRPWSRATLGGLLWPEMPEQVALSNLRNALSNLRRLIGDTRSPLPFLLVSETTLQFNSSSNYSIDLHEFAALVSQASPGTGLLAGDADLPRMDQAIALYRGEFLEGFSVDSAPFEEWILVMREQSRQKLLQALRLQSLAYEQVGKLADAVNSTRRYLELEPWDEPAYRRQMLLFSALGQRNAALALFETCRSRLAVDLGIEPEHATVQLYARIREGQPADLSPTTPQPSEWRGSVSPRLHRLPEFLAEDTLAKDVPAVFFARQKELDQLQTALEKAVLGQGNIIFVTGEPGSGKTALLAEFSRRAMLTYPGLLVAWGQCSAFTGQGDPYFPFLTILRMLAGEVEMLVSSGVITPGHARRLWKHLPEILDVLLDYGPDLSNRFLSGRDLLYMARMHTGVRPDSLRRLQTWAKGSSSVPGRGQLRQAALFDQINQVLTHLAQQHPLILVIDDLQWIDPGSVNLLFHLTRRITGSKILILGAYRPEEVFLRQNAEPNPLQDLIQELAAAHGDLQVDLMQSEGIQFVEELIQSEPNQLGQSFRNALYHHTSGNPLFAIELLRGMQLRGEIFRNSLGKWIARHHLNWKELPGRVEAVIARRIGHLSPECRQFLNIACVEGEQFTANVIAEVLGQELQQVCDQLSQEVSQQHRLVTAQSLQQAGGQNLFLYRFHHSLFQVYLYNQLDMVQKVHLHGKVGAVLEQVYGQDHQKLCEIAHPLARHFEAAGLVEKAVQYYDLAGKYALQLSASRAAIDHFRQALHHIQALPASEQRDWQALDLHLSLGPPITATYGWAAPDLELNYQQVEALSQNLTDDARLVPALWLLAVYRLGRAEHTTVDRLVKRFYRLAQNLGSPDLLCLAELQVSPLYQGRLHEARESLVRAGQSRDIAQQRSLAIRFGMAPSVVALAYLTHCCWLMGEEAEAAISCQAALDLAGQVDVPMTTCYALGRAAWQNAFTGQGEAAHHHAERLLKVTLQHGFRNYELGARFLLAWADAQTSHDATKEIELLFQTMQEYLGMGTMLNRTTFLILYAQVCNQAGQPDRALSALDEAITVGQTTGERWFEAEAFRLKGELLLQSGHDEAVLKAAETIMEAARQVAVRQGAKAFEVRANASLFRMHQQGKHAATSRETLADSVTDVTQ